MIALAAGAAALTLLFTVWAICRPAWQDPDDLEQLLAPYSDDWMDVADAVDDFGTWEREARQ